MPQEHDERLRVLTELNLAWKRFRNGHNLKDEKIRCCEVTQNLFEKLEQFEKEFNGKNMGGKADG